MLLRRSVSCSGGSVLMWHSSLARNGEQAGSCSENADLTLVSVCGVGPRLAMPGLNQGQGSEVRGPRLVTHLAPRIDLKQAGGTPCHWVQQGPQGLSRGCCSADLHSDNPDSASCFVSLMRGYQMRTFFARRSHCVYIFFYFLLHRR